ncbi:MAG: tetratricopeptide repeat protein [Rhodospirillaceae bacterium]|nr:tetratricopeptide repeat protein [Rhodospirillaceae bacterium]
MAKKTPDTVPAEKVDHELEGLMSEIESDIREEELSKIWKRYSGAMLVFAVALVLGVLGFQVFRQYENKERAEIALAYDKAAKQLDAGESDAAIKGFTALKGRRFAGGYSVLSRLGEAAALLQKKDEAGAVKIYGEISADTNADPAFRDLATVLRAVHSLDSADPKTLEAALAPVTNSDNSFSYSALEMSALLAAKQGNTKHAYELVQRILGDPAAPSGVRQRATDLAAMYKPADAAPPPAADAPVPVKAPAAAQPAKK